MNQFKSNIDNVQTEKNSEAVNGADEVIKKASEFDFFISKDSLNRLLPPLFMGVGVMVVYIALSHFHVKSLKEKEDLKKELNELRSEYISAKSNLMKRSNQSEVANRLQLEGVKELRTPPAIIEKEAKK
ncbi:MAG: FtsL-like putative cell division protein [Chitinophagaceae bacterium]